jgi:hypothetical protein
LAENKKSSGRISSKKLSNLKVVVLCIAAATTFWILNALNKDNYTTIVDYPIRWEYNREKYTAVQQLPESVPIQISGNGWDLLRKYFKLNEPPFIINLAEPGSKNYILTTDLKRPLGDFLTPTTLIGMLKDSLQYHIDPIETKKLKPVLDTTSYTLAKNVVIDGPIKFQPAEVTVVGPSSLIDSFNGKFPVSLNESRINLEDIVQLQDQELQVSFSIIQYLEGNKRLKLNKVNFPKSVSLENENLMPVVTYLIDGSKVTQLKDMEFEAVLNYSKRNKEDSTIVIEVRPNPSYLKEVKVEPPFVKLKYD